ncbi:AI-2E family transporter [Actinomadura scrupuli]|uniref:AI-2E family transporter n=1 Tax=Actinomadura scrupuli TaxID=559629 RepID=UPI003D976F86
MPEDTPRHDREETFAELPDAPVVPRPSSPDQIPSAPTPPARPSSGTSSSDGAAPGDASSDERSYADAMSADRALAAASAASAADRTAASITDKVVIPDPLVDIEQRKREAGVDDQFPLGRPGRPLGQAHPFMFGFTGALGVFVAYTLIQAIADIRQVLILITVSMFLAVGLNPAVERLTRVGISRRWGVALVFLCLVLFFVGFGFAIVPPLTEQITAFINETTSPTGYVQQLLQNPRVHELDQRYQLLTKLKATLASKDLGSQVAGGIVGVGRVVVSGIFSTLTILILTLYFLGSLPNITTFFYRLAPRSRRARVSLIGDEILGRIGGYVGGNILISVIAGVTTYIFLLIAGVPYPIALALIVAITDLIPLVGATIGAVLVTAIAFFAGLWIGIATLIFCLIYQQVENYLIAPRVMKRSVDVQPAVTVIAALIGGALLGMVGALLAIPAAAAVALILREVVMPRQERI